MRGWSFPLGRWFGVDLRIHMFFLLVLGFCLLSTGVAGVAAWRGIMMWLLLLLAVFVREVARLITAAYHDLHIRSILLLPIGGLFSYSTPESAERASEGRVQTILALSGPIANLLFAAVLAGLILGATTGVPIVGQALDHPHAPHPLDGLVERDARPAQSPARISARRRAHTARRDVADTRDGAGHASRLRPQPGLRTSRHGRWSRVCLRFPTLESQRPSAPGWSWEASSSLSARSLRIRA